MKHSKQDMKWGFFSLQKVSKFDTPVGLSSVIKGEKTC